MEVQREKGLRLWFWQRITAIILIFGIALHFAVTHFLGEVLSFDLVNERLQHLLWIVFDFILLIAALIHGFGGLWSIYLDYNPQGTVRRFWGWVAVFFVLILTVYGMLSLIALSPK